MVQAKTLKDKRQRQVILEQSKGAGNALVDTDGDGEGDTVVVQNTDAAYPVASGAYKNAISLFIDNDGVDGIPEEADAKQLALVTAQLDDLCNLGNQAACRFEKR